MYYKEVTLQEAWQAGNIIDAYLNDDLKIDFLRLPLTTQYFCEKMEVVLNILDGKIDHTGLETAAFKLFIKDFSSIKNTTLYPRFMVNNSMNCEQLMLCIYYSHLAKIGQEILGKKIKIQCFDTTDVIGEALTLKNGAVIRPYFNKKAQKLFRKAPLKYANCLYTLNANARKIISKNDIETLESLNTDFIIYHNSICSWGGLERGQRFLAIRNLDF